MKAARAHVTALEKDKAKISQHLWNVTDEIKKLSQKLDESELKNRALTTSLEEARKKLHAAEAATGTELEELRKNIARLQGRNDELQLDLRSERRERASAEEKHAADQAAIRAELEGVQQEANAAKTELSKIRPALEDALRKIELLEKDGAEEAARLAIELKDERTAHRELRRRMGDDAAEMKTQLATAESKIEGLQEQLAEKSREIDALKAAVTSATRALCRCRKI